MKPETADTGVNQVGDVGWDKQESGLPLMQSTFGKLKIMFKQRSFGQSPMAATSASKTPRGIGPEAVRL
jgi:hypothetical protein